MKFLHLMNYIKVFATVVVHFMVPEDYNKRLNKMLAHGLKEWKCSQLKSKYMFKIISRKRSWNEVKVIAGDRNAWKLYA